MPLKTRPATAPAIHTAPAQAVTTIRRAEQELIPGFGNVSTDDLLVPRVKLLQGLSPEVQDNPRQFFSGEYYHSALGEMLGSELMIVPLQVQRTIELWAPRDDGQGILARSTDGIHWDKPNTRFEVKLKHKRVVWDTKSSVQESGLAEFGSSDPGNPKSAPIASLTYRLGLFLVERPELGPALMIVSKTSTRSAQDLLSRVHLRHSAGTDFFRQQYRMGVTKKTSGPNEYYNPTFHNAGNVTEPELVSQLRDLAAAMARMNVRSTDETPDDDNVRPSRAANEAY